MTQSFTNNDAGLLLHCRLAFEYMRPIKTHILKRFFKNTRTQGHTSTLVQRFTLCFIKFIIILCAFFLCKSQTFLTECDLTEPISKVNVTALWQELKKRGKMYEQFNERVTCTECSQRWLLCDYYCSFSYLYWWFHYLVTCIKRLCYGKAKTLDSLCK